jgi:hypothetical protein
MSLDSTKTKNLRSLRTICALRRLGTLQPYVIRTYESAHWKRGETYTLKNLPVNLRSLRTICTLRRFGAFRPCAIRTYESAHWIPGETYTHNNLSHVEAIHDHR